MVKLGRALYTFFLAGGGGGRDAWAKFFWGEVRDGLREGGERVNYEKKRQNKHVNLLKAE